MVRTLKLAYSKARKILEMQYEQWHSIVTAQVKRLIEGPFSKQKEHVILTQLEHRPHSPFAITLSQFMNLQYISIYIADYIYPFCFCDEIN